MLDHAEDNLFEIERELIHDRHFTGCESILADCKEPERMQEVMRRFRPEVVFHAAAYKHVSLTEDNPLEAVRNNAIGRRCARPPPAEAGAGQLRARLDRQGGQARDRARRVEGDGGVDRRGARRTATRARPSAACGSATCSGSSGSVVPLFRRQIEQGGPVTVTHPDMERYFMTIPEAVQLIIRAGNLARGGEVFVLEMGEQVRIIDLARNMIRLSGQEPDRDIPIEIVGARPGEKLREELFNDGERPDADRRRQDHEGGAPPLDPDWVEGVIERVERLVEQGDETFLAQHVAELASRRGPRQGLSRRIRDH